MKVQSAINTIRYRIETASEIAGKGADGKAFEDLEMAIEALEKQKPKKVEYGNDNSWGVNKKVPVCPVCDYFLTQTYFIGNGQKITYCDHCGQKIQWGD